MSVVFHSIISKTQVCYIQKTKCLLKNMKKMFVIYINKEVTKGQRQNESQKAVMKSVGEIASKIWSIIYYLTNLGEILTLTFGH